MTTHCWVRVALLAVLCGSLFSSSTVAQPLTPIERQSVAAIDGSLLAGRLPKLSYRGGPFLRHPRIITVTFDGDDAALVSRLERFGDAITRSSWWRAVAEGYCASAGDCIGEGRPGLAVRLREALPSDVHAVEVSAILRRAIASRQLETLDAESLLLVYLPEGVTLKDALTPRYCGDGPRAFHRSLRLERVVVGYAVLPRCGGEASLTGTASHELLETVMNPDTSRPGFAFVREPAARGFAAAGSEAADPCAMITQDFELVESGFTVRRAWSALAAARGNDPCVPAVADRPFVAFAPEQPTVRLLNTGDSVTIKLQAAADRSVERWAVSAVDLTGSQQQERYLDVTLDRTEVTPGETGSVRVTLRKRTPTGLSVVGIVSTVNGYSNLWPLAVVTQ